MSSDHQNGTELSQVKPKEVTVQNWENPKPENEETTQATTIVEKIKALINFFTVEPFLLCYVLPTVISAVAVQKFNLEKACRVDLNYTEKICLDGISGNYDNVTEKAITDAQALVAKMISWKDPLQTGIPAVAILFVGAWSDKTGNRKALMLVPIFGEFVAAIGLILATHNFMEWPLWVTGLVQAIPAALTGGLSFALMGSYSFIADVTSLDSRTFRVGIVAVIVTLGVPLGSAISGVLTESVGYLGIFGILAFLYAFGFVYTYFRIHDVNRISQEGTFAQKFKDFINPLNAWNTISLLFLTRGKELIQIWLIVWAHIVVMGPVFGEGAILFYYTLKKYNMDIVDFSLFSTYSVLMGIAGTAIAVIVFSKFLSMHDALIGVIATTSKVVGSLVYGLAPDRNWLFAAPAFDFFGNSGTTVVRSLGTKIVNPDNVGKMCSLIGFVEAVVPVIYTPLYSTVYAKTLDTLPGAFYLLGGLMTVPAIFIFLSLYMMYRRQQRDVVKDPESKEKYARENDVTVL